MDSTHYQIVFTGYEKMNINNMLLTVSLILIGLPSFSPASVLLRKNFSGNAVDATKWHFPYWGGYELGRTIFKDDSYPEIKDGNVTISVESYNPEDDSRSTFYGTSLVSNKHFPLKKDYIHVKICAKINSSTPGVVGGIFLFAFRDEGEDLHDEIDFEIVTSEPDAVMTNVYKNEPLGAGHPQFSVYASGKITDYHTYEIKWEPDKVPWFVDGNLVRTETERVPEIPMELHLNAWVADAIWEQAYNSDLQPAASFDANQVFAMSVDSVEITTNTDLSPVRNFLLRRKR